MISVGIDVSKEKSMVCILKPYGEVLASPYEISHTEAELNDLIIKIKSCDEEIRVVLEATGAYHLPEVLSIDEELVVRYAQCSALFPMMQYSVAPWRILNEKNAQICLQMAKLHNKLGNEICELAKYSARSCEPIMRSMGYEFGDLYSKINDQFLLGDKILVAPVTTKNTYKREIIFPKGVWKGDDGTVVKGPTKKIVDAPIERLPYFIKQ